MSFLRDAPSPLVDNPGRPLFSPQGPLPLSLPFLTALFGPMTMASLERQLANGGKACASLPLFLQRKIRFHEAVAEDTSNTPSYAPLTSKRRKTGTVGNTDPNTFQPATEELFPAERVRALMHWDQIRPIGPGLANLGNTCFLNSVLQCLTYTPPLANYLLSREHSRRCRLESFCILCELERHIERSLLPGHGRVIQPTGTVGHLKAIAKHMRVGRQEDSHEFLRYLVEGMQRTTLAQAERVTGGPIQESRLKETTLVHQIFGGYLQSQVKCLSCQHRSNTFDPFLDLSLEVKRADSLGRALEIFAQPERLTQGNRYQCGHCGRLSDAEKALGVLRAPAVLTVHLKRFNMTSWGEMSKLNKYVEFPTSLDISSTLVPGSESSSLYELYAVLVHEGQTCNSGHYHAFVKASNGVWYSMNDSSVTQVSLATVLKQRAYMLFYLQQQSEVTPDTRTEEEARPIVTINEREPNVSIMETTDNTVIPPSPPATPDPVLTKEMADNLPTLAPPPALSIISNSMWHLSEVSKFKLEDFASLCHRLVPSSKWLVKLVSK